MLDQSDVIASMPRQRVARVPGNERILITLPAWLLDRLREDAAADMRSVSAQVSVCIAKFYAGQKKES